MGFAWKGLSNRQKAILSILGSVVLIGSCAIWYDSIVQLKGPKGGGIMLIAISALSPLQALYYCIKWRSEGSR